MLRNESFVVAVGGMSDVAGHGNRHFDSYPEVAGRWLAPAFLAAVAAAAASDRRVWKSVALPGAALSVVGGDPAAARARAA